MTTYDSDQIEAYLGDAAKTRLISRDEELSAAREIERTRRNLEAAVNSPQDRRRSREAIGEDRCAHAQGRSALKDAKTTGGQSQRHAAKIKRLERDYRNACHRLMLPNLRLVFSVVRKYGAGQGEFADLVQEGMLGLMRAVERYDCSRGHKFSTYAFWWIRQAVLRAKQRDCPLGHLTQTAAMKMRKIRLARAGLWLAHGRRPNVSQTAEQVEMSEKEVEKFDRLTRPLSSLNCPLRRDDSHEVAELVRDQREASPALRLDQELLRQRLGTILKELDFREREVICLRFGLTDGQPLSLHDIGRMMRLSRERIRQIEEDALRKLRQPNRAGQVAEFLDEPPAGLLRRAAELRQCVDDARHKHLHARLARQQRLKLSEQERKSCQTAKSNPDAA
jgi:RNA polymerase nonessential primary-like sigma factor